MRTILVIILSFGIIFPMRSEQTYAPRDYSVIPPSPNVSSLIKYNDISVSNFNGLPDISFPIYEITEGSLSVPLTLSYHGGGVRVDELESNMGLGWTLITGGVISRSVYGHPDEMAGAVRGLLNHTSTDKAFRQVAINTIAEFSPSDYNFYQQHRRSIWSSMGLDYYHGRLDMANDVFKVNCQGLSGTFIYNDSHNLVLSSAVPYSVSPSVVMGAYPFEYKITDTKGTEYYFTEREETKHEYYYGAPGYQLCDSIRYTSAWHLTKIKNIHNDSIVFHYEQEDFEYQYTPISATYYYATNSDLSSYAPSSSGVGPKPKYYPKRLKSIESSSVIVEFYYDETLSSMVDIIERIVVKTNNDQRQIVKNYLFEYEYYNNSSLSQKRIMLETIKEGNGIEHSSKYKFSYYGKDGAKDIPFDLPDQDFCGYYNEAGNNGLVPSYLSYSGNSSDRNVNPNVSMIGSLKTIEYPTGGKTELEWESHDYGYLHTTPVEMRQSAVISSEITDTLVGLTACQKLLVDNFTVGNNQKVFLDLTQYFNFNPQILMTTEYEHSHYYTEAGLNYPTVSFVNKTTGKTTEYLTFYLDKETIEEKYDNKIFVVSIAPGTYQVKLSHPTSVWMAEEQILREFYHADASCGRIFITRQSHSPENGSSTIYKDYWGGVRIKSIASYSHPDSIPIVKKYYYSEDTNPSKSSGVIAQKPLFRSKYSIVTPHPSTPGWEASEIYALSSNGLYRLPTGNVGVEYGAVNECYVSKDPTSGMERILKRSLYNYTVQDVSRNHDYNFSQFLECQPVGQQVWTSVAHRRGILTKKIDYNLTMPVETTRYEYNLHEPEEYSLFTTDMFRISDYTAAFGINQVDYSIGYYYIIPYNKTIRKEIFTDSKGYERIVEYTYFYDSYTESPDFGLVKSKHTTDSDGTERTIYYTYINTDNGYIDLVETEVTVTDGKITDARRMEYYPETFLLKATYSLSEIGKSVSEYGLGAKSASEALKTIITIPEYSYRYDSSGNIAEIRFNGEVLASYLWGYRGTHPIVEVKNISYDDFVQILASLGKIPENFLSATGTITSDLTSFYANLRSALPNHDITTMIYHWLIGASEATDSRGVTTYFTYDNLGRLSEVKDFNQYFIRKYDYHYKQ